MGDALPAGCAEDAAQRLPAPDHLDPRARAGVCGWCGVAAVDHGLAGPDAVDVAAGYAPCGHGP